jgi:hypothetical protein
MNTTQRVQTMKFVAPTGSTVTISHVPGKGFRSTGVIKSSGMSAKDLSLFVRTIKANGFTMTETV